MYDHFVLTLMLTHDCNLRCTYCYTGAKVDRVMPSAIGSRSIDRAIASLDTGGTLDLGFFGGEPLLHAELIRAFVDHARPRAEARSVQLSTSMTTNGTITTPAAWDVMMMPELELSISCDGLPEVHDRHRLNRGGHGTSQQVETTLRRLIDAGRNPTVVSVVRPDTHELVTEGIRHLQSLGAKRIQLSLDLWTHWTSDAVARLEKTIDRCARIWRRALPNLSISWFDGRAGLLAGANMGTTSRCGFGQGEIAVAPSGRLYPCERLIGEDTPDNPMVLQGHALDGSDFLNTPHAADRAHPACGSCAVSGECDTVCRCSNYVRTGDIAKPDGLLCAFNKACLTATANVLNQPVQMAIRV